ncbi:MAG TPA: DnaJ family domain-containing protein [Desulfobacteraceae bacterium]|nr:DnaJ family domain-containing protein [Desulfobacteraceae bacterium]
MIPGFEEIVEQRILKAQEKGEMDNLPGKGRPLTFEDENVPEELRLSSKILKNAGFLPPELELKKQIQNTEDLLATLETDSPEKGRIQKKLNFLFTKLNTMRGSSSESSLFLELYKENIIKRMS